MWGSHREYCWGCSVLKLSYHKKFLESRSSDAVTVLNILGRKQEWGLTQCRSLAPFGFEVPLPVSAFYTWIRGEPKILNNFNKYFGMYKVDAYSIFINIIFVLRNLGRVKKLEETFTIFSFGDGFCILRPFLWLLLKDLLSQASTWIPFNLHSTE